MLWCPNSGEECEKKIVPHPKSGFLIISYKENIEEINGIENTVREVFEEKNFSLRIAKEIRGRRNILCKICENIQSVAVVIVVYTQNTPKKSAPNIFYEAGMAHFLGKEVMFIAYKTKMPSDLSGLEWIDANDMDDLRNKLSLQLDDIMDLAEHAKILGKNEENTNNFEKAVEYYIKAVLISGDQESVDALVNIKEKIKQFDVLNKLYLKVNNFLKLNELGNL